jgi:inhibitor of growth protein 3
VERHICLLDQAIKEQEASLSEGTSRASLGTGDILPELPIPECPGKIRNAAPIGIKDALDGEQLTSVSKKRAEGKDDGGKDSASLVITIPPQAAEELYCYCNRISFGEVSNHRRSLTKFYMSHQMIGCDSESCEREWVGNTPFRKIQGDLTVALALVSPRMCWVDKTTWG